MTRRPSSVQFVGAIRASEVSGGELESAARIGGSRIGSGAIEVRTRARGGSTGKSSDVGRAGAKIAASVSKSSNVRGPERERICQYSAATSSACRLTTTTMTTGSLSLIERMTLHPTSATAKGAAMPRRQAPDGFTVEAREWGP